MKRHLFVISVLLAVLFGSAVQLRAVDSTATFSRKKIAVLDIGANNVQASYGNIVRNSLEVSLFNTDIFQLLDRDELKTAASRLKLGIGSNSSEDDIIKLGKSVSADFLVSGSIDKIDDIKITFKVYSIKEGIVIIAYSREISSVEKIDDAVKVLTDKILRDINTYVTKGRIKSPVFENHRVFVGGHGDYNMPKGSLKTLLKTSIGFGFGFEIDNMLTDNNYFGVDIGYSRMSGKENSNDSAVFIPVLLAGGYRWYAARWLCVKGEIGGGFSMVTLKHGEGEGFNMTDNTEKRSVDPMMRIGAGFGFSPGYDVNIEALVHYGRYFESGGALSFYSVSLGVMLNL
jgi:hypothetical protein